jgi:WD40 repeat protein
MPESLDAKHSTEGEVTACVLRWQELWRVGQDAAAEEVCIGRPDLIAEVARRIRILRAADQVIGGDPSPATLSPDPDQTLAAAGLAAADVPAGYEIVEELGRGGMGIVYKARQRALNRVVALKMILAGAHAGADSLARFRTEAEAIARLQHPGIVAVYEIGDHGGRPFFSLELCVGGSLDRKLAGTPLTPGEAAALVQQLALAMHAAHQAQVIHRDLKPANVLLAADGTPKISDFGLARKLDEQGPTVSGAVMGTPSYMAPEQAQGKKDVGPSADVYALGAILYEVLTGRPPFRAATALDTLMQVMSEEPVPPRQLNTGVAKDLETVCLKCLHKDPARRYDSAAALADDLGRWRRGEPIQARPVGRLERVVKWARRRPAVAGLLAGVLVVGGLGLAGIVWQWDRARTMAGRERLARQEADAARRSIRHTLYGAHMNLAGQAWLVGHLARVRERIRFHLPEPGEEDFRGWEWYHLWRVSHADWQSLDRHRRWVRGLAWSPDGKLLATGSYDHTVRVWDSGTGRELHVIEGHTGAVHRVAFNRDGTLLASASDDHTIRLYDLRSGARRLVRRHADKVWALGFTPDGRLASADISGQAFRHDLGSGREERIGPVPPCNSLACAPRGDRILFACDGGVVLVWDLRRKTGTRLQVDPRSRAVLSVAVSPSGDLLALGGREGMVQLWDLKELRNLRELPGHVDSVWGLDFSPDGATLVTASWDRSVKLWDVKTGKEEATLIGHFEAVKHATFAPDGRRLATASKDGTVRLWTLPLHQEPIRCSLPGRIRRVLTAPAGNVILVSQTGSPSTWRMSDGKELTLEAGLAARLQDEHRADLSLDGRLLLLPSGQGVELLERSTGKRVAFRDRCHEGELRFLALSPDGKTVLTAGGKQAEVRCWGVEGETLAPLGDPVPGVDVRSAIFSLDGKRVAMLVPTEDRQGDRTVRLWASGIGPPRPLGEPTGHVAAVAFSPDGKLLATGETRRQGDHITGLVRLWEASTGNPAAALPGYGGGVTAVAFTPDGRSLCGGDGKGVVKLWDPQTGEEKLTLRSLPGPVVGICFAEDGRTLATVVGDAPGQAGGIWLWPATTDEDILSYLERAYHADPESVETRIDLARLLAHRATTQGDAEAGHRARALLEDLAESQCPQKNRWLALLR